MMTGGGFIQEDCAHISRASQEVLNGFPRQLSQED